ncbi:carboxypeptidase regulatory-like domain-containing protein [Stieleria marina]|uniref:carboxypeptidase regulatory-like domain-containing protein n=1 Tax=Stieleria marina TaxID=1930275 RepID=UPI003AF3657D
MNIPKRVSCVVSLAAVAYLIVAAPVALFAQDKTADQSVGVQNTSARNAATQTGATYPLRMQAATLAEGDPDGVVFTVRGIIQDADGQPVPNATVVLCEGSTYRISSMSRPRPIETYLDNYMVNDVFARTTSDADGRYAFTNVAAPAVTQHYAKSWNWSVAACNSDGDFGWRRIKTGYQGPETIKLDAGVRLKASQPISGTALAVDGQPVAGAVVCLSSLNTPDSDAPYRRSLMDFDGNASSLQLFCKTGADGTFLFPKVPVDQVATVHVRHPNHQFKLNHVASGKSEVMQAIPRIMVRGKIVDESGAPIAGVQFRSDGSSAYTLTDAKGRFAWPTTEESLMRTSRSKSPADAEAGFFARVPDSDFVRLGVNIPVVELLAGKERTIVLQSGCRVTGKVVSRQRSEPVQGATVTANFVGASDVLNLAAARTDHEGKFDLVVQRRPMAVGVSGSVPGFSLPRLDYRDGLKIESELVRHIDLTGKEALVLDDFVVDALPSIDVVIVDETEQPVEHASVTAFYQVRQGSRNRLSVERDLASPVLTDREGHSRLLPTVKTWDAANIRVRAKINGAVWFGSKHLAASKDRAPSGDPLTIQLKNAWKLSGRVLIDNKPAEGINVALMRRIDNGLNSMVAITSRYTDRTITDRNGEYAFVAAPDETYSVSVTGPSNSSGRSGSSAMDQTSDHEYRFGEIALSSPGQSSGPHRTIRGRVVDFDGNPIADAQISSTTRTRTSTTSDAQGRFELKGLAAGQARLHVYVRGSEESQTLNSTFVNANAGSNDLAIRMDRRLNYTIPTLEAKQFVNIDQVPFGGDVGDGSLAGKVLDQDDQPIAGAVVRINAVKRRPMGDEIAGQIESSPSSFECGKLAITDAKGNFQIRNVSADSLYELAVGATGYLGNQIRDLDPKQPPPNVNLAKLPATPPRHAVAARIIDKHGKGIPGATIEVSRVVFMDGRSRKPDADITSATVTDQEGKFVVRAATPIRRMTLKISAGGYASFANTSALPGKPLQDIQLSHGSSLAGRLVFDGKPAAGVKLGLVQSQRSIGNIVTPMSTTTDENGHFGWNHLTAATEFAIYSLIDQDNAATLPVTLVTSSLSNSLTDLGEVPAQKGHRVALRFVTEDRKPIPPRAYCYLSRSKAWSSSRKSLPQRFAATVRFNAVPTDIIRVYVRVPDYEVVNVEPECQLDLNRRYALYSDHDQSITFTLRPVASP